MSDPSIAPQCPRAYNVFGRRPSLDQRCFCLRPFLDEAFLPSRYYRLHNAYTWGPLGFGGPGRPPPLPPLRAGPAASSRIPAWSWTWSRASRVAAGLRPCAISSDTRAAMSSPLQLLGCFLPLCEKVPFYYTS
jgi:hypothetical protein